MDERRTTTTGSRPLPDPDPSVDARLIREALLFMPSSPRAEVARDKAMDALARLVAERDTLSGLVDALERSERELTQAERERDTLRAERDEWKAKYEARAASFPTDTEFYGR